MKNLFILLCITTFFSTFSQPDLDNTQLMEAYLSGSIEAELNVDNIPGATLAVVHKGEVKILKGYGYADISNKKKVDPNMTLFRLASISKLFTWTGIMQLYEDGKLDLEDDISKYLSDLNIPDNFPKKITIKHLMAHCPGFEDEISGLFSKTPDAMIPLAEILQSKIPSRVRLPGVHSSYTNHGTGMAGHIIENITGKEYTDYIKTEILQPLGMTQGTFHQPIPPNLEKYNSKGYRYINGEQLEQGFEYVPLYPAGGASFSASSMAKFMMMFLNHGKCGDAVILDSATYELMSSPAHQHHPAVNPMRHGFQDMSQNGQTIFGHGGDLFYHHAILALLPDHDLGIFVAVNAEIGFPGAHSRILRNFVDHYFPVKISALSSSNVGELEEFSGRYGMNRYSHDDVLKLSKLAGLINVEVTKDGYLKTAFGNMTIKWARKDGDIFRDVNSTETLVFERDETGKIAHAFIGAMPIMVFDRLTGWDAPIAHILIFTFSVGLSIVTLLYWLISLIFRKINKIPHVKNSTLPNTTRLLCSITLGLVLVFYASLGGMLSRGYELYYGIPNSAYLILSIPLIIILLTGVLLLQLYKVWYFKSELPMWKKFAFTAICFNLVLSFWQWNYWNLIGYNF